MIFRISIWRQNGRIEVSPQAPIAGRASVSGAGGPSAYSYSSSAKSVAIRVLSKCRHPRIEILS
jgi:hypothetical protein